MSGPPPDYSAATYPSGPPPAGFAPPPGQHQQAYVNPGYAGQQQYGPPPGQYGPPPGQYGPPPGQYGPPPGQYAGPPPGQYGGPPGEDPAYPPGCNPQPYFSNLATQSVFSEDFQKQYVADFGVAAGETMSPGFLPAIAVPPNTVTEADECVCAPDQADMGCCFICRLFMSTFFHVVFFICIIGLIVVIVIGLNEAILALAVTAGVCFFLLWIETFCSYDFRYLRDIRPAKEFGEYMSTVHSALPTLNLHVECYHYETHYYTDSKGNRKSRRVKVTTFRESEPFLFRQCQDVAPPNINIEGAKATRIVFYRTFTFGDVNTRQQFEGQSTAIRKRNRHRDVHMAYSESFDVPGFKERMLAYVDPSARHLCFNPCIFVFVSTLCCTWPYRWWFRRVTAKTTYTFIKQLTK